MSENPALEAEILPEKQALVVRPMQAVGQALGVDEIIAQVQLIQNVMHRVMKEGEHFGTIPGCGDKKTLLQPGAQKLTMTFRLCPEYEIQEVNIERGHKEYRVICTLKSMGSGAFVGQGVGCCSTMESKYRWRGGARKCPKCGKEAIIMGKKFKPTDPEPGWLCWKKKEGCGATWPKGAPEIEGQSTEKVENENPADCYNTVLKMAKKRAFVDATITATAASDIFTQDIGDNEEEPEPTPSGSPAQSAPPSTQAPPVKTPPAPRPVPFPAPESRQKMISALKAGPGEANREICTEYFRKLDNPSQLLPNEEIEDLPLRFVPATTGQMRALSEKLTEFGNGERAAAAFPPHLEPEKPSGLPDDELERRIEAETKKPIKTPKDDEWWRDIVVPIPHKGQKRDDYLKHPETIGQLYEMRHGQDEESQAARQRLWGFINHYEPKGWTKNDGTQMAPSAGDLKFREALDALADWHERNHPDEKL